jgi:tetratricopeptide (TPR) repeat protein
MDAVTYPESKVIAFVNEHFISVRLPFDAQPYAADFNIKWTPSIITLDQNGKEHHRTVGFLAPEELIPSLYLGIGKSWFDSDQMDEALLYFDNLLTEYPKSDFDAEALYFRGVSRFKSTHDPKPLRETYEELNTKFPNSEWTKRAYPYRLLN